MFDFFEDLYLEAIGLDMEQIKKERREKVEKENSETILIKPKSKKYLLFVGSIFIIIHILGIIVSAAAQDAGNIFKSVVMIIFAVVAMICAVMKNKMAEILCIMFCILIMLLSAVITRI